MYDLLAGVRVLDLSTLAPSILAMNLADLGADVIKVEAPPYGEHTRTATPLNKEGTASLSHLRWNRGKRSILLDLKTERGVALFLEMAGKVDAIIDGMRAGTMDKLGVGYDAVSAVNPRVVFCSITGTGKTGPYARLAMHGIALDAFAGLVPPAYREDGAPYIGDHLSFGSRVGPLYGAFATAAALSKAARTGMGSYIDVAETDAAVFANADPIQAELNTGRPKAQNVFREFSRYQAYRTSDGKLVLLQPIERKFWINFCNAVERPDLIDKGGDAPDARPNDMNYGSGDEMLRQELAKVMETRTQRAWVDFFIAENIPGGPLNSLADLIEDPHFIARGNVYPHRHPEVGIVQMPTTPIKVVGQEFGVRPAPSAGEHTDEVLEELLGYDAAARGELRRAGAIK